MQVFGIAGRKSSGKTDLICRLLEVFIARGLRASAVKEARRDFDIDKPAKDSFQHRAAGAAEVVLASSHRWALMHERRGAEAAPELAEILPHMTPVDLVLVEGFRHEPHEKIEVRRTADAQPLLAGADPTIVAIAGDVPIHDDAVPVFNLFDVEAIADFIAVRCGLDQRSQPDAARSATRLTVGGVRD